MSPLACAGCFSRASETAGFNHFSDPIMHRVFPQKSRLKMSNCENNGRHSGKKWYVRKKTPSYFGQFANR
jgi:hypothetical protein